MTKLPLLLLLLALPVCAQLPDAPAPAAATEPAPSLARPAGHEFNPYSGHYVLGWKETATGKAFWLPYGALWAASITDAEITHQGLAHHRCVEGNPELPRHPSRGQLYRQFAWEDGAITVAGYFMRKLGFRWWTYDVPAGLGAGIHLHGASSWLGECW